MLRFFYKTTLPGIFFIFLFCQNALDVFAQTSEAQNSAKIKHRSGELAIGFNAAAGYNFINHVDGTLAVIPNKPEPTPSPGVPVYSSPISISVDVPNFSLEYWFTPSWSVKFETGMNLIVAGANHPLSDFAYLLSYWRVNFGGRYYFAQQNVDYLFLGLGWFADFPLDNPWIGFIKSKANARIGTGPYAEIGMTYPVTPVINIEVFGRFYFGLRALTLKSDPGILATIALSPFDVGFGMSWAIL